MTHLQCLVRPRRRTAGRTRARPRSCGRCPSAALLCTARKARSGSPRAPSVEGGNTQVRGEPETPSAKSIKMVYNVLSAFNYHSRDFFHNIMFLSEFQIKILLKYCNTERRNLISMETWQLSHPLDSCFTVCSVCKGKPVSGTRSLTKGNTHTASTCVCMSSRDTLGKDWASGPPRPVWDGWSLVSAAFSGPLSPYRLSRGHYRITSKVVSGLNVL